MDVEKSQEAGYRRSGAAARALQAFAAQTRAATGGKWAQIVQHAADIVWSYDTPVTLRQLFYRLVSDRTIPNTDTAYKNLSRQTAKARRDGWFPELADNGRSIERYRTFASPQAAADWLRRIYRRDRTEGQAVAIYLAVEKAGLVAQLDAWFGGLGLPIFACRGYSSETFERELAEDIARDGRHAVILYAGDFDASGEDIERNLIDQLEPRLDDHFQVRRVALSPEQVREYDLPVNPGKQADARAAGFMRKYGGLYQVEVDALPPETLRELYAGAISELWDIDAYDRAIAAETADTQVLEGWAGEIS